MSLLCHNDVMCYCRVEVDHIPVCMFMMLVSVIVGFAINLNCSCCTIYAAKLKKLLILFSIVLPKSSQWYRHTPSIPAVEMVKLHPCKSRRTSSNRTCGTTC